jgi:hypothetical protein
VQVVLLDRAGITWKTRVTTVTLKYDCKLDMAGILSEGTTSSCSLDLADLVKLVPFSGYRGDVLVNVLFTELSSTDVNKRRSQYSGVVADKIR